MNTAEQSRYQALIQRECPDAVLILSEGGEILHWNAGAQTLFGYREAEAIGASLIALLVPAEHAVEQRALLEQTLSRGFHRFESLLRRNDGTLMYADVSGKLVRERQGGAALILLTKKDVTHRVMSAVRDSAQRKRVEQAMHEKNIQLAEANRAKDRFLASMSHELRTPLNAIIGFTGTLLMKLPGALNVDQSSQLAMVQSSARHLLSLINDVLDVAKIEADKADVKRELVDCRQMLDELAATMQPLSREKRLNLVIEDSGPALMLHTDRRILSQIIINLIDNAIKYTERGTVTVSIIRSPSDAPNAACVSVQDTGPGISLAGQTKLFEAFSRLEPEGASRGRGTGLGLHLSRKLAELLGGSLICESVLGQGSTFILRVA